MALSVQDIAALSPVQKMDLADVLYDVALQEIEDLSSPLSDDQKRELDGRLAAADRGELVGEPWDTVRERIERES